MTRENRVKTGIAGLDEILEGGFLPGSSILLEGAPGTGKTNLGLQILYQGMVQYGDPGILVSFEQSPEQIFRDARGFGMDLALLCEAGRFAVVLANPMKLQETLAGVTSITREELEEHFDRIRPKRVLIDSISHFRRITSDEVQLRELLLQMLGQITRRGITVFLTKEIDQSDGAPISFEEYLVDASLRLYNLPSEGIGRNQRLVEVRKTRGHGHLTGRHPLRFTSEGIEVFPLRGPSVGAIPAAIEPSRPRVSTGVRGLDYLMHGGLVQSSSTLLAGTAGAGKTTFALNFVRAGLEAGEPCLLVTLNESPARSAATLTAMGVDAARALDTGLLSIQYVSPVDLCLSQLYLDIEKMADRGGVKRLVIDSVSDFVAGVRDPDRIRDYLYAFVKLFESKGITAVMTSEMKQVTGPLGMSDIHYAFVLDAVVYLGFVEIESQMRRVIMVLKQRGSDHETELRELILAPDGPKIGAKFTGLSGVSGGVATGKCQVTIDELVQPLTFIKGFAQQLREGKLPAEKQERILNQMIEQSEQMLGRLCRHFGMNEDEISGKQ